MRYSPSLMETQQLVRMILICALLDTVPFNCNTERLQGSSFSLEEELPNPDHPLESLFQDLRPGHLCTRQQR